MIVSELITKLQEFPQDLMVVASGYESGHEAICTEDIEVRTLVKVDGPDYDGTYQDLWNGKPSTGEAVEEPKEYVCLQ